MREAVHRALERMVGGRCGDPEPSYWTPDPPLLAPLPAASPLLAPALAATAATLASAGERLEEVVEELLEELERECGAIDAMTAEVVERVGAGVAGLATWRHGVAALAAGREACEARLEALEKRAAIRTLDLVTKANSALATAVAAAPAGLQQELVERVEEEVRRARKVVGGALVAATEERVERHFAGVEEGLGRLVASALGSRDIDAYFQLVQGGMAGDVAATVERLVLEALGRLMVHGGKQARRLGGQQAADAAMEEVNLPMMEPKKDNEEGDAVEAEVHRGKVEQGQGGGEGKEAKIASTPEAAAKDDAPQEEQGSEKASSVPSWMEDNPISRRHFRPERTGKYIGRQMDRQVDRQTGRHKDRQTKNIGMLTHRYTDTQSYSHTDT